jgi:hypothetical protein
MVGGDAIRWVGVAFALAGVVWLLELRRRGILDWEHGRVPVTMFIIGIWVDVLPLVIEAATRGLGAALDLFNSI